MTKYIFAFVYLNATEKFEGDGTGNKILELDNILEAYQYVKNYNSQLFRYYQCVYVGEARGD